MTEPLVAELVEHRDDVDRYLVLADALQTRGDLRGELIAIQCRLATSDDPDIRDRERELIAGFEAELRGQLPAYSLAFQWRYGFVDRVAMDASVSGHVATWRRIGENPCFQLVRSIQFHHVLPDDAAIVPALDGILDAPLATVERFTLDTERWMPVKDVVGELVHHFPRLHAFELVALQIPELSLFARMSDLAMWVSRMDVATLAGLMTASLPLLRRLVLGFKGTPRVGEAYAALAPMLDGAAHPTLEHLALMRHGFADVVIGDLPTRAILPRLRSIGVDWGRLTEESGQPALERAREAFAHLALTWPCPAGRPLDGAESYNLGVMLRVKLGRAAEALPHYARACELAPKELQQWWAYGNALGDLDRRDEQLTAYTRALEIDPHHASVLTKRGGALRELGRYDEAIESFTRAIDKTPRHASAWNELGSLHRRFGRIDEAIECFERAIAIDPTHRAGRNLVDALLEYRRPEHAMRVVETLRAAEPDDDQLARKQGRVHLALGDPAAALVIATQLCATAPAEYFNVYLRMISLRDLDRDVEALELCEVLATDLEPSHARAARLQRAMISRHLEVLELDGSDGVAHDGCADCAILAIAAAVLGGDRALIERRRAALDRFLDTQPPGYARMREWDVVDTIATVCKRADPAHAEILATSYAIATGRVTR